MLEVAGLTTRRGRLQVLHGCGLHLQGSEVVALLGPNGAGKSTMLGTIMGLFGSPTGQVCLDGSDIARLPAYRRVSRGVALVPERRQIFGSLTAEENLALGAYHRHDRKGLQQEIEGMFEIFPGLKKHRRRAARWLSGGEQQMLAIGRALMAKPQVLLLDEPSLGLAPRAVQDVFETLHRLKGEGMTILLAEQNTPGALELADRVYVLQSGKMTFEGTPGEAGHLLAEGYLGVG